MYIIDTSLQKLFRHNESMQSFMLCVENAGNPISYVRLRHHTIVILMWWRRLFHCHLSNTVKSVSKCWTQSKRTREHRTYFCWRHLCIGILQWFYISFSLSGSRIIPWGHWVLQAKSTKTLSLLVHVGQTSTQCPDDTVSQIQLHQGLMTQYWAKMRLWIWITNNIPVIVYKHEPHLVFSNIFSSISGTFCWVSSFN